MDMGRGGSTASVGGGGSPMGIGLGGLGSAGSRLPSHGGAAEPEVPLGLGMLPVSAEDNAGDTAGGRRAGQGQGQGGSVDAKADLALQQMAAAKRAEAEAAVVENTTMRRQLGLA